MPNSSGYWYIASYPKSGNTWVRLFITELQRLNGSQTPDALDINKDVKTGTITSSRIWVDDQLGINSCDLSFEELDLIRGSVGASEWLFSETQRFHKTHDAFISKDSERRPVLCTENCNGAIYVLRHPEDVAVSLSHFLRWPIQDCIDLLLSRDAALSGSPFQGSSQVRQHLGRWDEHVLSWTQHAKIPLLIVRYEDMHQESTKTFTQIAEFLHLASSKELIKKAIENTSINKLQVMEKDAGGFIEKPSNCSQFFRSGKVGEGSATLELNQRMQLTECLAKTMSRFQYQGAY